MLNLDNDLMDILNITTDIINDFNIDIDDNYLNEYYI
jgi:hypothetical protein